MSPDAAAAVKRSTVGCEKSSEAAPQLQGCSARGSKVCSDGMMPLRRSRNLRADQDTRSPDPSPSLDEPRVAIGHGVRMSVSNAPDIA